MAVNKSSPQLCLMFLCHIFRHILADSVAHVKVEWNSFDSAETKQLLLPADQKDISLDTFGGGVNHFIRFFGVEEHGIVVTKSKQITALSAKKLEPPVLKAKYEYLRE